MGPVVYDCVTVIVVRDGSAIILSEFGQKPVKPGDVLLLGANVLCAADPEEHITVTTVCLDPDYVLDQVRWPEPRGDLGPMLDEPPAPINWNLLRADEAENAWLELNQWVNWLRVTYGLPASVIPPMWHRH